MEPDTTTHVEGVKSPAFIPPPPHDAPAPTPAVSTRTPPARAAAVAAPRGDANLIGSPDIFLADRHRELPRGSVRIVQVKSTGVDRAYVITEGTKVGYFELTEGMDRAAAEAALRGAFDGTAIVL